ncbi:ricin-type beta-trefoil lectin domain protein [Amycolatopsis sp. NBC_01480]|uniref:ricin-type beta-trefoil lectin domain protein n=1 Tax=Amycolatopsis sp. NBC_01480 TaxID=2903562 RepID=UPI002E2A760F|nr:ricin-type beta-trefoil lectin domain protein [Amycolatopsis sp. NBC_01480]
MVLARIARLSAVLLLALAALIVPAATATAVTATDVSVNGTATGRTFDGLGAISGGGGNSRLLRDYPPEQQAQLLDYLFKPGYGAAVQLLKLEIGGDANSTDGAEPSHEHVRGQVNCDAGYEFWLGEQAVARNPGIKLVALPWAAPGWIGGGNFWSQDMIDYDISWLGCAKQHGLTISYLGGWNEKGHNTAWYKDLRTSLDANGYGSVQIVGDDTDWGTADDMLSDPAFGKAVGVVGAHYPCGYLSDATSCASSANAVATGKPLWASEFGSQDQDSGAQPLIRSVTRGYLDGQMTGFMNWPIIASLYPNLPFDTVGLATANSPWSGSYQLGKNLWATAQVTQFTQPGWKFLTGSASGYLGGDRANGSYISLKPGNGTDYSTIYETTSATSAQTVNVKVSGGLGTGAVHVWSSDLGSSNQADYFVKQADVTPQNGSYSLTLQPGRVYSVTTTTGQGKGTATAPPVHGLPLPYADNFDGYPTGTEAKYFSDMQGAFESRPCVDGRSGQCLQQVAPVKPIEWQGDSDAYGLIGDLNWRDYSVAVDVDLRQSGTVTLLGRANTQNRPQSRQAAYQLRLDERGAWSIAKNDSNGQLTTLASGTAAAPGLNSWHRVGLSFSGDDITATLDGATLGTAADSSFPAGQAGFGVVGYQTDLFDNLSLAAAPPGNHSGVLKGLESGICADVPKVSDQNGTAIALWDCNGGVNQQWTATPAGQLMVYGTKCLDGTDPAAAQIQDCTGAAAQKWDLKADGTVVNGGSGQCLTASGTAPADGLGTASCTGAPNQGWSRSPAPSMLQGQASGRCADVPAGDSTPGTRPTLWDCHNGSNQEWTSTATNQLTVFENRCLDVVGGGTADGTPLQISECTGSAAQQWRVRSDGAVVNVASGQCLDAAGGGTADSTPLVVSGCTGSASQKWARV